MKKNKTKNHVGRFIFKIIITIIISSFVSIWYCKNRYDSLSAKVFLIENPYKYKTSSIENEKTIMKRRVSKYHDGFFKEYYIFDKETGEIKWEGEEEIYSHNIIYYSF